MTPKKLDNKSADGSQLNLEALYAIAPSCFTEVQDPKTGETKHVVNFDTLRTLLGNDAVEGEHERYQFTWPGKQVARLEAAAEITETLRPVPEDSVDWDTTENLYIEGDNLRVLKLLQKSYLGKIKMIYIDPPYNTGNDFLYNDNTIETKSDFNLKDGSIDELGACFRKNMETDGRFHSKWCSNIYSRLLVAKNLLSNDGVVFISIDDTELHNLIKICNEVFGESNYLNTISVKAKSSSGASGGGEDKKLKKNIEYIVVYVKSQDFTSFEPVYSVTPLESYIQSRKNLGKTFAYTSVLVDKGQEQYLTTVKDGQGENIELYRVVGHSVKSVSQLSKELNISQLEVYNRYIDKIFTLENAQTSIRDRVINGTSEDDEYIVAKYKPVSGRNKGVLTSVGFMGKTKRLVSQLGVLCEKRDGKIYKKDKIGTLWDDLSWSSIHTESCIPYLNAQKPLGLLQRLIDMQTDNDSIVLDFYGGSSTTGHAVFLKNLRSKACCKFILVQIQETIDPQEYTNKKTKELAERAVSFLNSLNKPNNVCELGKERLRTAITRIKAENPEETKTLDMGFRVFKLDSSNYEEVSKTPGEYDQAQLDLFLDNIKTDRNDLDLLFGAMLSWGVPLSLSQPLQTQVVDGCTIYNVTDGELVACFAEEVTEAVVQAMAALQPERVLFRDSCFAEDKMKINLFELFKQALDWDEKEALDHIRVI